MRACIYNMSGRFKITFFLFIITGMISCKDIFEEDLSDKTVIITAPSDNLVTTDAVIHFYWEEMTGARTYRIQIAKPSFSNLQQILTDTSITGTDFTWNFSPGTYQWRIRAENGSSQSDYTTYSIEVDSTTDLSGQQLILISPSNNYMTNQTSVAFNWYDLYNADQYSFLLKENDFNGALVIPEEIVTDNTITLSNLAEGKYGWGVRGENANSNTNYFSRIIWIDLTAPNAPTLTQPANNSTFINQEVTFTWTHATDTGTPLSDSIYIYSDQNMTTLKTSAFVISPSYTDSLGIGTYYWRVISIDAAGNRGTYSSLFKYTAN